MKFDLVVLAASLFAGGASAHTISLEQNLVDAVAYAEHLRRALPDAPDGYTPTFVDCPSRAPVVRSAASLSPNETQWVAKRRNNTIAPMRDLLNRLNITGFDAERYIDRHSSNVSALPNIGIAMSGGGWRALMNGAGAIKAFDSRTQGNTAEGHLGGLLQSTTYLAGLSGGSWLVGSLFMNNWTTVGALQADNTSSVWEFGNSVIRGPEEGGIQIFNTAEYYGNLYEDVSGKEDAGFDISLTDIWGRGLSYQLINASDGGPAYTWSSIGLSQGFQNANTPFPVIIADARAPGETLIPSNTSVYEFNPYEMGTWDPTAFGFVPTRYLGTNWTAGEVAPRDQCVRGFDNAGFLMGTSSSLFNQFLLQLNGTNIPSTLQNIFTRILTSLSVDNNDIADYTPNPFYHYNRASNPSANSTRLTLVDGGEDLQNIPFHPLIQPTRNVDVIFAIDSSADTSYSWPNGTAIIATYQRSLSRMSNGTAFPAVPDSNTFVNLGLNTRPTFFGCNSSNFTDATTTPPLVVYIPNSPYVTYSNISTFQLSTNNTMRDAIILNGLDVASMGNGTVDEMWPTCVACAILSRSFERTGTDVPAACTRCFDRFCWDGTVNSTKPSSPYEPEPRLDVVDVQGRGVSRSIPRWAAGVAAATLGYLSV